MLWLGWMACGSAGPTTCDPPGDQVEAPRAAGCVTFEEGRLLLVRTGEGWTIPGGRIESGEAPAAAAERETWEEAHVQVRAGALECGVASKAFVAFTCARAGRGGPSADGDETTDARFMTVAEIEALPAADLRYPDQRASYLRMLDEAG